MDILCWKDLAEEKLSESIARQMFWGQNIMVTKWTLAPGTALPTHEHESEQVTMVQSGSVTLLFPDDEEHTLNAGDMLVIPGFKPHGVRVGPQGCSVLDLFSPIRKDFIEGKASYLPQQQKDPYIRLHGVLRSTGMKVTPEELREVPLDVLARYVYDKECITMGQLREILGLDKKQAKDLLRQWKHGDDHSESSLKRKLERLIAIPGGLPQMSGAKKPSE
ncbi:MAG: cupin domain-containing protein [Desulfomonile tiedjei]|uniref:Cupin domain-containing protein n=1 Tax=Desulfomonile tiedjei TaxID=2358 RepID=A0A9D6UZF8_9BACT|nr:cupin domain-containing protein [Desulfomonile tiedjei]